MSEAGRAPSRRGIALDSAYRRKEATGIRTSLLRHAVAIEKITRRYSRVKDAKSVCLAAGPESPHSPDHGKKRSSVLRILSLIGSSLDVGGCWFGPYRAKQSH